MGHILRHDDIQHEARSGTASYLQLTEARYVANCWCRSPASASASPPSAASSPERHGEPGRAPARQSGAHGGPRRPGCRTATSSPEYRPARPGEADLLRYFVSELHFSDELSESVRVPPP